MGCTVKFHMRMTIPSDSEMHSIKAKGNNLFQNSLDLEEQKEYDAISSEFNFAPPENMVKANHSCSKMSFDKILENVSKVDDEIKATA